MLSPIGSSPDIDTSFVTTVLNRHKDKTEYGF